MFNWFQKKKQLTRTHKNKTIHQRQAKILFLKYKLENARNGIEVTGIKNMIKGIEWTLGK